MIACSIGRVTITTKDYVLWVHVKRFFLRALKDALFKLAFQGAFGHFWGALMSIPQVRHTY